MIRLIRTGVLLFALLALAAPAVAQDAFAKRLSLDLKAMAPAEAFKVIATAIGYTVNVAPDVATPVDIVIPNVTAKTALDTICDSIGCAWQVNGTVITVRKRAPGGLLGSSSRAHGSANDKADLKTDFRQRMRQLLPADMKFDRAPMAQVADRLSKATGIEISFVSAKSGQTLSADMSGKTLMEGLKTLSEQYQGAITLTMQDREGKRSDVLLQLGTANRTVIRPRSPKK